MMVQSQSGRVATMCGIGVTVMVMAAGCSAGAADTSSSAAGSSAPTASAASATAASSATTPAPIPSPTTNVALTQPTGCSNSGGPGGFPGGGSAPTPTYANVAYANVSPSETLDLFVPPGEGPFPLIIRIHGGAFKVGDKAMDEADAQTLMDAGFALASINYRLSCEALFPAAPQDVLASVRFLRANAAQYNVDPTKFATWGAAMKSLDKAVAAEVKFVWDSTDLCDRIEKFYNRRCLSFTGRFSAGARHTGSIRRKCGWKWSRHCFRGE